MSAFSRTFTSRAEERRGVEGGISPAEIGVQWCRGAKKDALCREEEDCSVT